MGCEYAYDWKGEGCRNGLNRPGSSPGCILLPILFNIFSTEAFHISEERLRAAPRSKPISRASIRLLWRWETEIRPRRHLRYGACFNVDDTVIESRSSASLAKVMTTVVEVCGVYGLAANLTSSTTDPPRPSRLRLRSECSKQRFWRPYCTGAVPRR